MSESSGSTAIGRMGQRRANYQAPDSWPSFIAEGLPFGPIKAAELQLLRALSDAKQCRTSLFSIEAKVGRYESRYCLIMAGNNNFLASLDEVEQLNQPVLCLKSIDCAH
jgi:hypothetical protein